MDLLKTKINVCYCFLVYIDWEEILKQKGIDEGVGNKGSLSLSLFFLSLFLSLPESLISLSFFSFSNIHTHINTKEHNFYLLFMSACHFLSILTKSFFFYVSWCHLHYIARGTSLPLLGTTVLVGGVNYILNLNDMNKTN